MDRLGQLGGAELALVIYSGTVEQDPGSIPVVIPAASPPPSAI